MYELVLDFMPGSEHVFEADGHLYQADATIHVPGRCIPLCTNEMDTFIYQTDSYLHIPNRCIPSTTESQNLGIVDDTWSYHFSGRESIWPAEIGLEPSSVQSALAPLYLQLQGS